MTDAEIICTLMEPNPGEPSESFQESPGGWWIARYVVSLGALKWLCSEKVDSLDALHEVEDRLAEDKWRDYAELLLGGSLEDSAGIPPHHYHFDCCLAAMKMLANATTEQKIKALAAVLRAALQMSVEGDSPSLS